VVSFYAFSFRCNGMFDSRVNGRLAASFTNVPYKFLSCSRLRCWAWQALIRSKIHVQPIHMNLNNGRTARHLSAGVERWAIISTCFVVLWSFVELPWEMDRGMSVEESSAILTSKLLLVAIAVLSFKGITLARYAFAFLCLVSVAVIAVAVSSEYANSRALAFLSTIELGGKLSAFMAVASQLDAKARRATTGLSLWRPEASTETRLSSHGAD
jgi:hypothetical protein